MTIKANEGSLKLFVIKPQEANKGHIKKLHVAQYVRVSVEESNETVENHSFSTIENMDDEMLRGIYIPTPTHEVFTRNPSDMNPILLKSRLTGEKYLKGLKKENDMETK